MSLEGFRTAHPRPRRCPRPRRRSGGGAAAGGAGGASERPQRAGVVTGTAATRRVSVLGSTGSVGRNTLDLISRHPERSEEHTSELQSLMRISYAVFCLKKKNNIQNNSTLTNVNNTTTTINNKHTHHS